MRRTMTWFVSGLLGACVVAPAAAAGPTACAVMTKAEAEKLVGGPLGDARKHESRPNATNGGDHHTTCGYYPKGHDPRTAEKPADRGISIQLHALPKPADAMRMYEGSAEFAAQVVEQSSGKNGKVVTVSGFGEAGFLAPFGDMPTPFSVATLAFVKGNVMAQVQAYRKSGGADEIARAAAKQVAARLP